MPGEHRPGRMFGGRGGDTPPSSKETIPRKYDRSEAAKRQPRDEKGRFTNNMMDSRLSKSGTASESHLVSEKICVGKIECKDDVVLDTNVLIGWLDEGSTTDRRAAKKAIKKDNFIYLNSVDVELNGHSNSENVKKFRAAFHDRIVRVREPNDADLKHMRVLGNDKKILFESLESGADMIVTHDKKFKKRGNGYKGINIIEPAEYISRKRRFL